MASASPEASAQPINNRVQAQLKIIHLALLDHPRLLLCTWIGCKHGVVLVPTLEDVVSHLSKHRVPLAASGRDFFQEMLKYDGFYCCLCGYTIKSRSTGFKHIKDHRNQGKKPDYRFLVTVQLIHKASSRYLLVRNAELDPTPQAAFVVDEDYVEGVDCRQTIL